MLKSALFDTAISLAILCPFSVKYSLNLSAIFLHRPRVLPMVKIGWTFDFWFLFIHDIFIPRFPYIVFTFCKPMGIIIFFAALIHYLRYPLHIFRLHWLSSRSGESGAPVFSFLYKFSRNLIDLITPVVIQGDSLSLYLSSLTRFSGKCLLKLVLIASIIFL